MHIYFCLLGENVPMVKVCCGLTEMPPQSPWSLVLQGPHLKQAAMGIIWNRWEEIASV